LMIHIIHTCIENLAFGQLKLKIALHRPIGRTKRLVAKLLFCFEPCSNELPHRRAHARRRLEKTLARSAFLAFCVALRHSTFCRFGQK